MLKKMLATIKQNELIATGDTVLVALSGGPDSVALLEGLLRLRRRLAARHGRRKNWNRSIVVTQPWTD